MALTKEEQLHLIDLEKGVRSYTAKEIEGLAFVKTLKIKTDQELIDLEIDLKK